MPATDARDAPTEPDRRGPRASNSRWPEGLLLALLGALVFALVGSGGGARLRRGAARRDGWGSTFASGDPCHLQPGT